MRNSKLARQVAGLQIPYPQKHWIIAELKDHMDRLAHREEHSLFSQAELDELSDIHNTRLFQLLDRLDRRVRRVIENVVLIAPLVAFALFIHKEQFMIEFVREGGAAMLPILLLGVLLASKELLLFFRLAIVKDHSDLNIDSTSVLVGGFALLALGHGSSALSLYVAAQTVATNQLPTAMAFVGFKEAMAPMIVSAMFSTLALLTHFVSRRLLVRWKAPVVGE